MTDRNEKVLSAFRRIVENSKIHSSCVAGSKFGATQGDVDVVENALTLATESEQLRKERDELKKQYKLQGDKLRVLMNAYADIIKNKCEVCKRKKVRNENRNA